MESLLIRNSHAGITACCTSFYWLCLARGFDSGLMRTLGHRAGGRPFLGSPGSRTSSRCLEICCPLPVAVSRITRTGPAFGLHPLLFVLNWAHSSRGLWPQGLRQAQHERRVPGGEPCSMFVHGCTGRLQRQVLCASYNPVGFPRGNLGSLSSSRSGLSCPWSAGYVPVQALITSRDTGRGPTAPHDTARPVTQF